MRQKKKDQSTEPMPRTKTHTPDEILSLTKRYIQESLRLEPLSIKGFYKWCIRSNIGSIHHYFENTNGSYTDYCEVIVKAKALIEQSFIGKSERNRLNEI